ncbi:hypothetical protein CICLE_v10026550mg [Citrus x clementina]|uniref:ADP,ATP carrier protein n=1 Tax=Citrus clementina TaxID=85681 RepID=V4SD57_CITCL|nr:hypothetical protein CICLE_v10026550mg [Citrus x clementina]
MKLKMIKEIEMVKGRNHHGSGVIRLRGEEKEKVKGHHSICAIGGMLSAGTSHLAITPLDVLKVNMQVHPIKYSSIASCYTTLLKEQGPSTFWRGWAAKFFGYGAQGGCRFGLYEYFKSLYSSVLGDCNRSLVFFLSSASAEGIFGFYRGLIPLLGRNLPCCEENWVDQFIYKKPSHSDNARWTSGDFAVVFL